MGHGLLVYVCMHLSKPINMSTLITFLGLFLYVFLFFFKKNHEIRVGEWITYIVKIVFDGLCEIIYIKP